MAMTTKYVTVTGAGAKNGTDAANAWDWATMLTSASAGDDILIQEGTYSLSSSSTFSNAGTSTSPIRLRGAKTDWTPLTPTRTNAGPLSTANMPVIACASTKKIVFPAFVIAEALKFTGTMTNESLVENGTSVSLRKCVIENASTNAAGKTLASLTHNFIFDCDISATGASGSGYVVSATTGRIIACRIMAGDTACDGILASNAAVIERNVIKVNGGHGVNVTATSVVPMIAQNTIVGGGGTSDGILCSASMSVLISIWGNLITDHSRYGINGNAATVAAASSLNRIDRCTSGAYNSATDWLASTKFGDDVTSVTQANEYEDAAGGDFRLKSTSPAIGKGPWGLADIGALQTTGGGSTPAAAVPFSIGGRFGRRA